MLIFSMPEGNIIDSGQIYGFCGCAVFVLFTATSVLSTEEVFYDKWGSGAAFAGITDSSFKSQTKQHSSILPF